MAIPLVFLCFLTVGCQQGGQVAEKSVVNVDADIQAIKEIVADITAAVNAADIDTLVSFYADDAVRIPSNEPAAVGKEAIQIGVRQMFDEISAQEKDVVEDVRVGGDLAVAHVVSSAIITPKAGNWPSEYNGNMILVFKREADETWKIIYSIWSNESLILPDQAE